MIGHVYLWEFRPCEAVFLTEHVRRASGFSINYTSKDSVRSYTEWMVAFRTIPKRVCVEVMINKYFVTIPVGPVVTFLNEGKVFRCVNF